MSEDLVKKFNDLSIVMKFENQWGQNIYGSEFVTEEIFDKLKEYVRNSGIDLEAEKKKVADYRDIIKHGPEKEGYEHAVDVLESIIKTGDKNIMVMEGVVGEENMKSTLPKENHEEVKKVAEALNLPYTLKMLG